mmetsp:Transcript_39299/g.95037  ORF Transcript_39299/g.95037 Transcript_39299/m.95037 type:complete len:219 (-) Transcript_39299:591-1247(-)
MKTIVAFRRNPRMKTDTQVRAFFVVGTDDRLARCSPAFGTLLKDTRFLWSHLIQMVHTLIDFYQTGATNALSSTVSLQGRLIEAFQSLAVSVESCMMMHQEGAQVITGFGFHFDNLARFILDLYLHGSSSYETIQLQRYGISTKSKCIFLGTIQNFYRIVIVHIRDRFFEVFSNEYSHNSITLMDTVGMMHLIYGHVAHQHEATMIACTVSNLYQFEA